MGSITYNATGPSFDILGSKLNGTVVSSTSNTVTMASISNPVVMRNGGINGSYNVMLTTLNPHGMVVGDSVTTTGATNPTGYTCYIGTYVVITIISAYQFIYYSTGADAEQITTSTTSSAIASSGSKVFTLSASNASFTSKVVRIVNTANAANYMIGTVTSNSGTSLTVTITSSGGSGTYTAWTIGVYDSAAICYPQYAGRMLWINPNNSNSQTCKIASNTATVITSTINFLTNPSASSSFAISYNLNDILQTDLSTVGTLTCTSSTSNTITGTITGTATGNPLVTGITVPAGTKILSSNGNTYVVNNYLQNSLAGQVLNLVDNLITAIGNYYYLGIIGIRLNYTSSTNYSILADTDKILETRNTTSSINAGTNSIFQLGNLVNNTNYYTNGGCTLIIEAPAVGKINLYSSSVVPVVISGQTTTPAISASITAYNIYSEVAFSSPTGTLINAIFGSPGAIAVIADFGQGTMQNIRIYGPNYYIISEGPAKIKGLYLRNSTNTQTSNSLYQTGSICLLGDNDNNLTGGTAPSGYALFGSTRNFIDCDIDNWAFDFNEPNVSSGGDGSWVQSMPVNRQWTCTWINSNGLTGVSYYLIDNAGNIILNSTTTTGGVLASFVVTEYNFYFVCMWSGDPDTGNSTNFAEGTTSFNPFILSVRYYGYQFLKEQKTIVTTSNEGIMLSVNPYTTASLATAAGYSSLFTINGVTRVITLLGNASIQQLYDYTQYWAAQLSNITYDAALSTSDSVTYSSTYNINVSSYSISALSTQNLNLTPTGWFTTSTTSNTIVSSGNVTFAISGTGGSSFIVGVQLKVVDSANTSNYMIGTVTSGSTSTSLILTISSSSGSGTFTTWNIGLAFAKTSGGFGGGVNDVNGSLVGITLNNVWVGSSCYIAAAATPTVSILNTVATGTTETQVSVSASYLYAGVTIPIIINVRKGNSLPSYLPYSTTGVITSTGFSLNVSQVLDTINTI